MPISLSSAFPLVRPIRSPMSPTTRAPCPPPCGKPRTAWCAAWSATISISVVRSTQESRSAPSIAGTCAPTSTISRRRWRAPSRWCAKLSAPEAMPIVLGGDHAVSIPVLRAFEGRGPITLIQIDQHLDWRDEVNGIKDGLSSPMRRASEMEHIGQIYQIGLSATGSARQEEVEAARAWGAHLIPAHELHEVGIDAVLRLIPDGGRYYLTVDMDGMDCAIAPAVAAPMPGGV